MHKNSCNFALQSGRLQYAPPVNTTPTGGLAVAPGGGGVLQHVGAAGTPVSGTRASSEVGEIMAGHSTTAATQLSQQMQQLNITADDNTCELGLNT